MTHDFAHNDLTFSLTMPEWAVAALNELPSHLPTKEARMAAVIDFARRNVHQGTGGPFAAGVFERDSGRLVVIGVNRVMPHNCSSAHAEIMALSLAQKNWEHTIWVRTDCPPTNWWSTGDHAPCVLVRYFGPACAP